MCHYLRKTTISLNFTYQVVRIIWGQTFWWSVSPCSQVNFQMCFHCFSDSYHIWCKRNKNGFGWDRDLFICFIYIPLSSSTLSRTGQSLSFETLQSECAKYERKGWVLLCGDFTARTNDVNDKIENDELDDYLSIGDNYLPDQQIDKRLTKDKYPINANGTAFIEFCKSSGYRIMRGRVDKNNSSNFTCFANRGNSVVDYALLREENFSMVDKTSVSELCELSDHSSIEISIKSLNVINESETRPDVSVMNSITSDENMLLQTYKNQYYINDASKLETLSLAMENNEIPAFLENISNHRDNDDLPLEEIIALLRTKMIDLSEAHLRSRKSFGKTKNRKTFNLNPNCPWFDAECLEKKQLLSNKRKNYQAALKLYSNCKDTHVNNPKSAYFNSKGFI